MSNNLIKQLLSELSTGNFARVWMGGLREIESRTSPYTPLFSEYITEEDQPSWLNSDLHSYGLSRNQFSILLDEATISVETEFEIEAVEVQLTNISKGEAVEITTDSDTERTASTISVDSSFIYGDRMWHTTDLPAESNVVDLAVDITENVSYPTQALQYLSERFGTDDELSRPRVGLPAVVPAEEQPPVIMISIDTLRHDARTDLEPLVSELGPDAYIPDHPRTQGTWTLPSHASMFTGTHPGRHGLVGWGDGEGDKRPIDPAVPTIPELLTDRGYKCSGVVQHSRITPGFGFGGGFHRLYEDAMTWDDYVERSTDAQTSVNRMIQWIGRDITTRDHSLFYFLHVFDPHLPYVPPVEYLDTDDIDLHKPVTYRDAIKEANDPYIDAYEKQAHGVSPDLIDEMKSWYSGAVEYTAEQVARLLRYLKHEDLFDKSLIIITGDHGEEFGERQMFGHGTVNEGNIRPFMAIKPPAAADWGVRDSVDTVDFLPTIAAMIGADEVSSDGVALQDCDHDRPRITERIRPDWYTLSVEADGYKGIFVYESAYPDRPTELIIDDGPVRAYFRDLSTGPGSGEESTDPDPETRDEIRSIGEEFVRSADSEYSAETSASRPSQETMDQLEKLGYR